MSRLTHVSLRALLFPATLTLLVGCDPGSTESSQPVSLLDVPRELGESRSEPTRVRPPARRTPVEPRDEDPCAGYGDDPGVMLVAEGPEGEGVVVPDACIAQVPGLLGCWVAGEQGEAPDAVDIWCDFACEAGRTEVSTLAVFPPEGTRIRIELMHPCASET